MARVPKKDNSAQASQHEDLHYTRAQVAYVNEMMETYGAICLSCDDKNKINVGTPAVSRYHQLSKFFLQGDAPKYYNHHFP